MARGRAQRRRKAHGGGGGHEGPDERWLLTYADMITLLMALFIVLWSMSTTDTVKFRALSESLHEALGPKLIAGGDGLQERAAQTGAQTPAPSPPIPAMPPVPALPRDQPAETSRGAEDEEFARIKASLDAYAREHGLRDKLEARIARRGLVVRLMTDNVLFASGQATLQPRAVPLLGHIGAAIRRGATARRPILVEGHTDDVPVSGTYPSNWELSTARATSVVRFLIAADTSSSRLGAAGYADQHPAGSNATAAGRARNRRVEIVLLRQGAQAADQEGSSP